jgi:RNA polymerase sigma-70 factor (ECF subfamily)
VQDLELAAVLAPDEPGARARAIGEALRAMLERGRQAWPGVPIDEGAFVAHVGRHLPRQRDVTLELPTLDAEGLFLACACAGGNPVALQSFETALWPDLGHVLSRMGLEATARDDLLSRLREILFFGDSPRATPLLGTYAGRGSLRSWARSVATFQAIKARRKDRPLVAMDDQHIDLPALEADPELAYLRSFYVDEFRAALARAMRALALRERNLLRQHYLDGLTLEALARVYGVHRATAARWLAHAREVVLATTRSELAAAIHVRPSELESVLAFVQRQSTLGVHLSGVFAAIRDD